MRHFGGKTAKTVEKIIQISHAFSGDKSSPTEVYFPAENKQVVQTLDLCRLTHVCTFGQGSGQTRKSVDTIWKNPELGPKAGRAL